jgi:HAE1 family hydrophobic/amphiphilic exporter-1
MLYESFIHPLTILSTRLRRHRGLLSPRRALRPSVVGIIGIILLIGIVKKNGIALVDFATTAERDRHMARRGDPRACLPRFRRILMTTAAAMLAGVPLMPAPAPARNCASRSATPW